jgi:hypothetical protein
MSVRVEGMQELGRIRERIVLAFEEVRFFLPLICLVISDNILGLFSEVVLGFTARPVRHLHTISRQDLVAV